MPFSAADVTRAQLELKARMHASDAAAGAQLRFLRTLLASAGGDALPASVDAARRLLGLPDFQLDDVDVCPECGRPFCGENANAQTCPVCVPLVQRFNVVEGGVIKSRKVGFTLLPLAQQLQLIVAKPEVAAGLDAHLRQRRHL